MPARARVRARAPACVYQYAASASDCGTPRPYSYMTPRLYSAAAWPLARISLVEIAQQAGNGFELAFFAALDLRLREVVRAGGSYCELHSLGRCVKMLRQRRHWSSACDDLRAEIVAFARRHTAHVLGDAGAGRARDLFLHVT